jgi:ABC-2 type transport system permease protein
MLLLVRREFWEHRMLVIAPAVLCVLYLILCALAAAGVNVSAVRVGHLPSAAAFLIVMHVAFTTLLYGLMAVVAFFYLCDCLYAERKDRTILFWKSLPVSDTKTVLSKLIVALIAMPLVVYLLSLVTNVIAFMLVKLLFHPPVSANPGSGWTMFGWLRMNAYLLLDIPVLALWFAPVAAYQLLISVLVPRAPFVFTLLPPLTLIFGEALFLGTWNVGIFIGHRLGAADGLPRTGRGVEGLIDSINTLPLLQKPELWIGVALAAAVIYLTIRIRRHSDDS